MDKPIYIHYGNDFDIKKFEPAANCCWLTKPKGGFWASRQGSKYGWIKWCDENEFGGESYDKSRAFKFTLSDTAKVLIIKNKDDLIPVADKYPLLKLPEWEWRPSSQIPLDFEALAKDFDAMEVFISSDERLYNSLYTWDCDSLIVFNPKIIIPYNNKKGGKNE